MKTIDAIKFCLNFQDKQHLEIVKILLDVAIREIELEEKIGSLKFREITPEVPEVKKEDESKSKLDENKKVEVDIPQPQKLNLKVPEIPEIKVQIKDDKKARILEMLEKYIGMTYNKLKIIDIAEVNTEDKYKSLVVCQCECGNKVTTKLKYVIYGEKKSCGCLSKKKKKETNKNKISSNVSTGGLDEVYKVHF